jgi:HEPN domain-containing protein
MSLNDLIQEWLHIAESDIQTAQFLMDMRPRPLEIICFHCQQSVEKNLKAFLVCHDIEPEKTHNLLSLINFCNTLDQSFESIRLQASKLDAYAVRTRYPYENKIDEIELKIALESAMRANQFIIEKIKQQQGTQ